MIRANNSDSGDYLRLMLSKWLERHCITWKGIVTILKTPDVGEHQLADQLETKHCLSEHSSTILIIQQYIVIELEVCFKPYLHVDYKYMAGSLKKYMHNKSINLIKIELFEL